MAITQIPNPGFEAGDVDWDKLGGMIIQNTGGRTGPWCARAVNTSGMAVRTLQNFPVVPGQSITLSCWINPFAGTPGAGGDINLIWMDSNFNLISSAQGNTVNRITSAGVYSQSTVTSVAPAGAAFVAAQADTFGGATSDIRVDDFDWNYQNPREVNLTGPSNGDTFEAGDVIPLRVGVVGDNPASVEYKATNTISLVVTSLGTSTSPTNFPVNYVNALAAGEYDIQATATYADTQVVLSTIATINVGAADTREYKASNSYTYLVGENFSGLTANMPSTAIVTGVELVVDYGIRALVRSKDIGNSDPTTANENVAFDIVNSGTVEAVFLQKNGSDYTVLGTAMTDSIPIIRSDFSIVENGTSEGKRWTVFDSTAASVTMGAETELFGQAPLSAFDFADRSIGFRFYPVLGPKPAYADTGDACFRFLMNKFRLRVYFDAGSAEYYFASPDKTQVIKGFLVSSYVDTGAFSTGDAAGVLQLKPELEIMDGTQTYIGDDWTIHAAYPPTDANQIGEVDIREANDGVGMSYNGLPDQQATITNRSRYVFITANFFGDRTLDSIYGANGVDRGFAYNGDFFYKIQTTPDETKDKPRHVAYHHSHLALGFDEGRTDISVVGEPWNFDGAQGASSWTIGDSVVGLLPLSGTILGVFGSKSIWGISGTTVDNFATQVISPNIGAIEYTITDMGYPVYANAYGIYTLSQTQQYGDYLGSPMSQDISPWLRPRLVRKITSAKEVVVAWPVRHKNQYRLAFSDGYILTMTMNGQQAVPTFSFQKYFITEPDSVPNPELNLFEYRGMVPVAVSSELDEAGEERIHIADMPVGEV